MDLTRKMTKTQNQMNNDVKVPDGAELIDEVFYVWKTRMGLYSSMTKHGHPNDNRSQERRCHWNDKMEIEV